MAKADNNVPFQTRPRFNIVGVGPSTIIQRMAGVANFGGKRALTPSLNADLLDPVVTQGKALWSGLSQGGIFFLGGNHARPLVIESYYSKNCSVTAYNVVAIDDPALETTPVVLRTLTGAGPFKLGPNECISVVSTGAVAPGAEVGFVVRLEGQKVL